MLMYAAVLWYLQVVMDCLTVCVWKRYRKSTLLSSWCLHKMLQCSQLQLADGTRCIVKNCLLVEETVDS